MCTFIMGGGIGGTEKKLRKASTDYECANRVKYKQPNANGASRHQKSHNCYAEFGATGTKGATNSHACIFSRSDSVICNPM